MKKIAFLGCENGHVNTFLNFIKNDPQYSDIEVLGVYSNEKEQPINYNKKYGCPIMNNYDDLVGQVDGIVVTARDGANHLKYAKPYLESGIPMFIDKPITVSEEDALELIKLAKQYGVQLTGGSSGRFDDFVLSLKKAHQENEFGKTLSGYVRCPIVMNSPYGGFYFYAQHLTEIVCEIFSRYPTSVFAKQKEKTVTVLFNFLDFTITGVFVDESFEVYYALRMTDKNIQSSNFKLDGSNPCFKREFQEFVDLLNGEKQVKSYEDFIAPVFVMNAIDRSLKSGKEELVHKF